MPQEPLDAPGIVGSLRVLGDSLLAGLKSRLELLSLELQDEKYRLIQIFIWISAIVFSAVMAIMFLSLTAVYLFWETARIAVLGTLTALYVGAFVGLGLGFRAYLKRQPKPFAATLEELEEDRACIRKEN